MRLAGATPVLVDVDPLTFTLDPGRVDAAVTPRTRAVVPVHVSGRSAITRELLAIARYHGLRIVEDAAEALGSRRGGQALGTFGDAGCFSFTANKTITTGQGGLVVTRDPALHRRLRELKDQGRPERGTGGADVHVSLGYNFKFTNLQAAMGLAQLEDLGPRVRHLRRLAELYRTHLAGVPRVWLPPFRLDDGECPQWIDLWTEDRDGLHDTLQLAGIQTRKFWLPLHTQAPYRWDPARFPVSSRVSVGALWLPSSLTLAEDDIVYVCREIASWARRSLRAA
jgi:perosamine synthetase